MKLKSTSTAPILGITVMLMLIVARQIDLKQLSYQDNICLAVIVLQILILLVPSAFYMRLRGDNFAAKLRIRPFGAEKILATALAALTIVAGTALLKLFMYQIGAISGEYSVWHYFLNGEETNIVYNLLTFCVIPAISEEILFRGVMCVEFESGGALTAAVLSAGIYAMFGLDFGYFPIIFFAGLGYALVYYMTRTIFAPIICHLLVSLSEFFLNETVWNIISKPHSTVFLIFALAGIFLLCLASLFSECERIYFGYSLRNFNSSELGEQSVAAFLKILLSPPYLCAVLIFIVAVIGF